MASLHFSNWTPTYRDGHYFYFAGNHWRMNKTLGANDNYGCETAIADPDTFLPTNWTVWDVGTNDDLPIFGRWVEDKDINKCASDYTRVCTPCSSVTINCDGQPPDDDVRNAVGLYYLLPDQYSESSHGDIGMVVRGLSVIKLNIL